jgi:hypothetical protein
MHSVRRVLSRHPFFIIAIMSWLMIYVPALLPEATRAAAMPVVRVLVLPIWIAQTVAMVVTSPLRSLVAEGWLSGVLALVTIGIGFIPFLLADAALRQRRALPSR